MTSSIAVPEVESLAKELSEAYDQLAARDRHNPEKQDHFYLSNIHGCARHLYYQLHDGEKRPQVDVQLQKMFKAGKDWEEKIIVPQIMEMGFAWIGGQKQVTVPYQGSVKALRGKKMGSGKIDGIFRYKNLEIPGEIKTTDPNKFRGINTIDDFLKDAFGEKWVMQLLMYLYAENREQGIFLLSNTRGAIKPLPLYLGNHLELAEAALKRMEKAYEARYAPQVEGQDPAPDRIEFHQKICGMCPFASICLPQVVVEGKGEINDPEVEALLDRHERLHPIKDEYDEVHDSVVAMFSGKPETVVGGRFVVRPSQRSRTSYDSKQLDEETRKRIKKVTPFWVVEIDEKGK